MKLRTLMIAGLACFVAAAVARGETLAELVKKEEGIEFGPCALAPKPKLAGEAVHAVIPARFETPGIWVTRTLLLVGVDAQANVLGTLELKLADDVPPREVVKVTCAKDRLTIRLPRKNLSYAWTGTALRKR
jgi:hypothetical protein